MVWWVLLKGFYGGGGDLAACGQNVGKWRVCKEWKLKGQAGWASVYTPDQMGLVTWDQRSVKNKLGLRVGLFHLRLPMRKCRVRAPTQGQPELPGSSIIPARGFPCLSHPGELGGGEEGSSRLDP